MNHVYFFKLKLLFFVVYDNFSIKRIRLILFYGNFQLLTPEKGSDRIRPYQAKALWVIPERFYFFACK